MTPIFVLVDRFRYWLKMWVQFFAAQRHISERWANPFVHPISGGHFILPASLRYSMREASSSPWQANVLSHIGNSLFEVGTSAQCKTSQFGKKRCNLPEPAMMLFTRRVPDVAHTQSRHLLQRTIAHIHLHRVAAQPLGGVLVGCRVASDGLHDSKWDTVFIRFGMGRMTPPLGMGTWTVSSAVPGTSRSVSSLPRCVETAMRLQGRGLARRPAQPFRGAPFDLLCWPVDVGSSRNMDCGFINSWNVYVGKRSEES